MAEMTFRETNSPSREAVAAAMRWFWRYWDAKPRSETADSAAVLRHIWRDGVEYLYTSGFTRCLGRADAYQGGKHAMGPDFAPGGCRRPEGFGNCEEYDLPLEAGAVIPEENRPRV